MQPGRGPDGKAPVLAGSHRAVLAAAAANNRGGGRPRKADDPTAARAREIKGKGISAGDIGKMLGVSRATVHRYLAGEGMDASA
ncbi:helix-turn-helix domain-containing protein [Pseudarthrobacter sp. S9]|uniref:helix-turn-helix domain-containing protein n=1 Tax=Pseudarthrobacter sp. S9 TaxID=3418421 RepID=UPI003D05E4DC